MKSYIIFIYLTLCCSAHHPGGGVAPRFSIYYMTSSVVLRSRGWCTALLSFTGTSIVSFSISWQPMTAGAL